MDEPDDSDCGGARMTGVLLPTINDDHGSKPTAATGIESFRPRRARIILGGAELLERRQLFAAYAIVDLGTLGGAASFAYDINNNNQVVGYAQTASGADRAFRFADTNGNG